MKPILQVFYSIISGLLLALAIPNEFYLFGSPAFTLLALIPLYLAFSSAKSYKTAFIQGFTQTISTHLASSFWLAYFKDFAALTLGASAVGTGLIGGFFGLFLYLPFMSYSNQNKLNDKSLHISLINSPVFRIIYFASLYTLYEWVKSSGFLGYPWGTVSAAMFKWPVLMQLSAITGTYGITFIIVIINGIVAELILLRNSFAVINLKSVFSKMQYTMTSVYIKKHSDKKSSKPKHLSHKKYKKLWYRNQQNNIFSIILAIRTFSVFMAVILVYGIVEYYKPRKPEKELTAILVQQNLDPWSEYSDEPSILISQSLTKQQLDILAEENKKPDIVVWSEGCLRHPFPYSEEYYSYYPEKYPLTKFIADTGVPFLIGGSYLKDEDKYHNAALMFDENGRFRGFYGKTHLVPLAESSPFIEYPAIKSIMENVIGISAGWYPGEQYVYFEIPCKTTEHFRLPKVKDINITEDYWEQQERERSPETVKFSTPICFDDAFTDVMRPMFLNGAELFINITDDSWSLKESSEIQHFAIAAYRAIEYRTTLIRSANAGSSVVVTPDGRIINHQPLFQESSTVCDVPVYKRHMTTYARFGNWLPYTIAVLFIIYSIYMGKKIKTDR